MWSLVVVSDLGSSILLSCSEAKLNKRPRGLDTLLGHLLVKRIPVTFQLSSTKIPEYLSQKYIQGRRKLEMYRMTPN